MTELTKDELLAINVDTEVAWYDGKMPRGRRPQREDARVLEMGGKRRWVLPGHEHYDKAIPVRPSVFALVKEGATGDKSYDVPSVIEEIGKALVDFGTRLQEISSRAK